MIKVNEQVEVSYEFDRYSDKDISEINQAFSYVCRNTNVSITLLGGRMTINGDVESVATVHKRVKEYLTIKNQ